MNFTVAGLPADKMVEAHGTFSDATCLVCRQRHDKEDIKVIKLSNRILNLYAVIKESLR